MALEKQEIVDILYGFQKTQILFSAGELGVFEELTNGPLSSKAIAAKIKANPDATERLLNACVGLKLLNKTLKDGETIYNNPDSTTKYLTKSSPDSVRWMTNLNVVYPMWGQLKDCVVKGDRVSSEEFFNYYVTPTTQLEFMRSMHIICSMDAPKLVNVFDLSSYSVACDLGGSTGSLAKALVKAYPTMKVTVMDRSDVVQQSRDFMSEGRSEAISYSGGDFFVDAFPDADLYILAHTFHNWSPEKLDALLDKIMATMKSGGALLVLEKFLDEDKSGPMESLLLDMDMLLCAEGRERSLSEYKEKLEKHGFTDIKSKVVENALWYDAIICKKK
ncbi:unnamed protein product [Owenia fusiformis]|uniref:Acetylserotonin O-methyltransferase n=1 Tax=Owenia fusiformis TaxID=6347 RepID=A0A8J1TXS9_OWEFU|nr:unnamed protein product [Owenia fusiformis]